MTEQNRLQQAWHATFGRALEDSRSVWPFFVMATAAMAFVYFWSIQDSPRLQNAPALLVAFTVLNLNLVDLTLSIFSPDLIARGRNRRSEY